MRPWLALAGLAALGAWAAASSRGSSNTNGGNVGTSQRKQTIWAMLQSTPLDDTQRAFLMVTAYGEGRYSSKAHNSSASEIAASAAARANLSDADRAWLTQCGVWDKLATGSWGTFQRLAPYLALDAREIFGPLAGCSFSDPTRTSLAFQVASAIETARDLQSYNGWLAYPTVGNLRLGWASPGFMGYIAKHADRLDKYRRHAREVGYPESLIDAPIGRFPEDVAGIYKLIVGVA